MKAMLLAAGEGTRLRPLTNTIPKCMVPINGKPILEHNIEWIRRHGVTELIINLYYLPHVIQDYFREGSQWGVQITYSVEKTILGTAGGVKHVAEFFDDTFLVWYADNLSTCDLTRLTDYHHSKKGQATITLYRREEVTQSGIVDLDDQARITRFLEKPKAEEVFSNWVNAGILVLEPHVLSYIPRDRPSDFSRDVFPAMLGDDQSLFGYCMSGNEKLWWVDTVEDLDRTRKEVK